MVSAVQAGAKFSVNLKERSAYLGKKALIKNGEYEGDLGVLPLPLEDTLEAIEAAYDVYNHSIPSERSDSKQRLYFRALPERELEDDDMLYGVDREYARCRLEMLVLCSILTESLRWNPLVMGNWFWQSQKHPSLIILREWVEE